MVPGFYPLLLALGVLCGCGIATFSVGIGQVAYWFPQAKQGRALGIYAGLGNLAPGLFSLLLPLALGGLGLANSYLIWLVFLAAGTLLYAAFGRNAWFFQGTAQGLSCEDARHEALDFGQELFPSGGLKRSLGLSARNPKTWALVGVYFTTFGGFIALTAWFPTYWHGLFGMAAVASGLLTATYSIATSIVRVGGGALADRFGGECTAMGALAVMLGGSAVMSASHTAGLSIAGALLMAAGMGVGNAATFKLVSQEVPEAVGGAAGWIGGLGAFGGFVLPPVLGYAVRLWGSDGYALGFIAFDVLAASGLLLAFLLKRFHGRSVQSTSDGA